MTDFQFLENPLSKKWVILAPRRARRPDVAKGAEPVCPFCLGKEKDEQEIYRVRSSTGTTSTTGITGSAGGDSDWLVRVLPNKFPFAPIHELIIHSPDHHKNFDELPISQVELILQTYRNRYKAHQGQGQVYIFHNRGAGGGESLPHPHTQIAVVPLPVRMDIPRLDPSSIHDAGQALAASVEPKSAMLAHVSAGLEEQEQVRTEHFYLFCPKTSQWPDEVWIAPKARGRAFGEITDKEITNLAYTLARVIQIFNLRHGNEFPFNFYIYPGGDWYLRLIPRTKSLGGFEIGTGIFVNTQDPAETIAFLQEHFEEPDEEKIRQQHQADYERRV